MKRQAKSPLWRGVVEVINKKNLESVLKSGRKLRVKLGIDPTAADLHLGHAVLLKKLGQFQKAGHQAVLIIGDFTALIGDPSGRSETRSLLTQQQVKNNLKKYRPLIGKFINLRKAEIYYNSRWFAKGLKIFFELASKNTVQQVLHRADFKKRLEAGGEISLLEAFYPLLQAYDSVAVRADVEIGGTDQKFNLLMGRRVQGQFGLPGQHILTLPIIVGTDGVKKMSKSYGNYIALDEKPAEMFGKIMSIPDSILAEYFELLTDIDPSPGLIVKNPRAAKLLLAKTIAGEIYGAAVGAKAKQEFVRVFSQKGIPVNVPVLKPKSYNLKLINLLLAAGIASKSEARRLVQQGGVKINGEAQTDYNTRLSLKKGVLLQIGKRRFFKIN